jgi:NADPH:quinone reductase-like Zn-dependent oxidoreductase
MYAQYRVVKVDLVLPVPPDVTPKEAAAAYVNPLTALGFVETLRLEGHIAMIHTAAASNLGQMLVKLCLIEGVDLINIVRSAEHVTLLKDIGAKFVLDSTSATFMTDLVAAIDVTGATLAFDAIGGGVLGGQLLQAMEISAAKKMTKFDPYGSSVLKQLYIYSGLDTSPTILERKYGYSWAVGGWLVFSFLKKVGEEKTARMKERVLKEIKTTFSSKYTAEISLADALKKDTILAYFRRATGEKYMVNPNKGL